MTAKEFIKEIEGYYGEYERPMIKAYVLGWAKDYEPVLDLLFQGLLRTFSGRYGKAPDIAVLEDVTKGFDRGRGPLEGLEYQRSKLERRKLRAITGPNED